MKVLSVASECVPLIKTGGLADVAGALPAALAPLGVGMHSLVPGYQSVMARLPKTAKTVLTVPDCFGGKARVLRGTLGDGDHGLYVLDAPHLYDRDGGPYLDLGGHDWPDNPERFAALSWVAALIGAQGVEGWKPQALHAHDWQAGFAPYYLRKMGSDLPCLMTIHNIAFAGIAAPDRMASLRLESRDFTQDKLEFWGNLSALKAGLVYADKISTVSPGYAAELMRPQFGMGLEGLLSARRGDLHGILNGIDETVWSPPFKTPKGKARLTKALRREMGLPASNGPLCVVVSRLSDQKGLDLLLAALPCLTWHGGQLALLGSGDKGLEAAFLRAAEDANIAVRLGYDEALAQRLIAGGDVILVPSRFEPCGLTQLYGLRFGTLPLVALTGGLADTVVPLNAASAATGVATGFQFSPVDQQALEGALVRMCATFADKPRWAKMQRNAMRQPVGWDGSARAYAALFAQMVAA